MPFPRERVASKKQKYNSTPEIVPASLWTLDHARTTPIFFWKPDQPYGYFCQWYLSDMVDENGQLFNCCEQYMMYHKAKTFNDLKTMAKVLQEKCPKAQKELGKNVEGFNEDAWSVVKKDVVIRGNLLKFNQGYARSDDSFVYPSEAERADSPVSLKHLLLATAECTLAEASKFDRVWGIGFCAETAQETPRELWGQNLLGEALHEVRLQITKQV